jgi:hypothetical protein
VRAELTNWTPPRYPVKGGSWMDGYTRTGFFLAWCKDKKKPTFLIELNHAARDMATFTWDAAFQQILGQGVQQTWNEYPGDAALTVTAARTIERTPRSARWR